MGDDGESRRDALIANLRRMRDGLPDGGPFAWGADGGNEERIALALVAEAPEGDVEAVMDLLSNRGALEAACRQEGGPPTLVNAMHYYLAAHLATDCAPFVAFLEESVCVPERRTDVLRAVGLLPGFLVATPESLLPALQRASEHLAAADFSRPFSRPFSVARDELTSILAALVGTSSAKAVPILRRMRESGPRLEADFRRLVDGAVSELERRLL